MKELIKWIFFNCKTLFKTPAYYNIEIIQWWNRRMPFDKDCMYHLLNSCQYHPSSLCPCRLDATIWPCYYTSPLQCLLVFSHLHCLAPWVLRNQHLNTCTKSVREMLETLAMHRLNHKTCKTTKLTIQNCIVWKFFSTNIMNNSEYFKK